MSRSFAQSYFSTKNKLNKNINETNISEEVKPLMEMIDKNNGLNLFAKYSFQTKIKKIEIKAKRIN